MQLDMTKGKPMPVILRFTFPLMIGNMFQQLYNMADTIIVGRYVGADALAAVGSTGTIMFLITGFSQGITSGFSIRVSQRYGARDTEAVRHSVANGIFLSVLSSLILILLQSASASQQMSFTTCFPHICERSETVRFLCSFLYFLPV